MKAYALVALLLVGTYQIKQSLTYSHQKYYILKCTEP